MSLATPSEVPWRERLTRRCASANDVKERLSREILRKLELARQSALKEDTDAVCTEILDDLAGRLDAKAREVLESPYLCPFYEILSEYYRLFGVEAEKVVTLCRGIWGQPYIAAIFSLLLHKWLLQNEEAGGQLYRHKYLNVLWTGCRDLFWMDIQRSTLRFSSLFLFISHIYTSDQQRPFRHSFLVLIGQFLPYYHTNQSLPERMAQLPFDRAAARSATGRTAFTPDVLFAKMTEMLKELRSVEDGLVQYLRSLRQLRSSPLLTELKTVTRLQFQAQLYSFTSQGGPHYPSPKVQTAAFLALDALYPAGSRTRKIISHLFKVLHPLDWPRTTLRLTHRCWSRFLSLALFFLSWISFCFRLVLKPVRGVGPQSL